MLACGRSVLLSQTERLCFGLLCQGDDLLVECLLNEGREDDLSCWCVLPTHVGVRHEIRVTLQLVDHDDPRGAEVILSGRGRSYERHRAFLRRYTPPHYDDETENHEHCSEDQPDLLLH